MGLCVRPNRYALALATGSAVGTDVFALRECDNPVCVKVSGSGALCEHVVAGTQFDNMRRRRMARARRGGGRPTIRGLGRDSRRARVRWRCARPSRAACGMPMRSPMRCSASNHVCSEAHSGRASFEGREIRLAPADELKSKRHDLHPHRVRERLQAQVVRDAERAAQVGSYSRRTGEPL